VDVNERRLAVLRRRGAAAIALVLVGAMSAVSMRSTAAANTASSSGAFVSLVPARVLDTRADGATLDGLSAQLGVRAAYSTTELAVAGRGGVAGDASAVMLNVTATEADRSGYVTVFPCGAPRPLASSVNFTAGVSIANAVVSKVGTEGQVCLFVSAETHIVVDVDGYFPNGAAFSALMPARLLDTRDDGATIDGLSAKLGLRTGGSTTELSVGGRGGAASDATAVVLNVTATEADGPGYVTVFPCGAALPWASNVNFVAGISIANTVVSRVGAGGRVCLFVSNSTHLVVDVVGSFPPGAPFWPLVPARLLDSRPDGWTRDGASAQLGLRPAGSTTELSVLGRGGVAMSAAAVVLNVTATEAGGSGYVTVFPCGSPRPLASSLNFTTGASIANTVVSKVGTRGNVCIFVSEATHLVVDVDGYFLNPATGPGGPPNTIDLPSA
jgi:hypothetical protein